MSERACVQKTDDYKILPIQRRFATTIKIFRMHKVRLIAWASCAASVAAVVACCIYVPVLFARLDAIGTDLKVDMNEFHVGAALFHSQQW